MKLNRSFLLLFVMFALLPVSRLMAQTKTYRVLFAVTSSDKTHWGFTLGNVREIMATLPLVLISKLWGWGAGVTRFLKGSEEEKNITSLEGAHVHFLACEFSLANRKLTKADVLPGVHTGIEAITKYEQGWTYIKN
jgi:intracellular sulfur oxidation DsrE/DsrF family protein